MHSSTFVGSLAALASFATAIVPKDNRNGVTVGVAFSPATPTAGSGLGRRGDVDYECASSVATVLAFPTPGPEVFPAVTSALLQDGDFCSVTMAASLSSEYEDYLSEVKTYYNTVFSKASGIHTLCGAATFSVSVTNDACATSLAAFFTDAADHTESKSFPPFVVPTGVVYLSAAAGQGGIVGSAVAVAAVLGAVLSM